MGETIYYAFTVAYDNVVRDLKTDAILLGNEREIKGVAQWDTGASSTCISERVVSELNQPPIGVTIISTPAGQRQCNKYLVDIVLPNNVKVTDVEVIETEIGTQQIDVLIGMDIITLGDFVISNNNGKTTFSYRFPSKKKIDFVQEINIQNTIGQKHGKGKRKHK